MFPRTRGPGTLEMGKFTSLRLASRLDRHRYHGGDRAGGRYATHDSSTVGPSSRMSSLAIAVATDVSRTRSNGSSMCTGSDRFMALNSLPESRPGEVSRLVGTDAMIGWSARPS